MVITSKDKLIKYLITLLPIALVLSIFFSELILFIISIFFIRDYFLERNIEKNWFYIFLIIFVFYIAASSISIGQELNLQSTFFYFRFLLYFFGITYYLKKLNIYVNLIKSFIFTASILIIDGIFQFIFGFNIIGLPQIHPGRVSSFFGDELILGSYLVRLIPFFLIFFIFNFKNKKILRLVFLLSLLFIVLLSGERTAIFLLLLSLFIFFIFLKKFRKTIYIIFTFFFISLSILVTFNKSYNERYLYNVINSFGLWDSKKDGILNISFFNEENEIRKIKIFSKQHEDHYLTAYNMFSDKYIFGHGPKSFRAQCKNEKYRVSEISCATHPHNILMQFLSELGLVGFIFLLMFHTLLISELIKIIKNKNNLSEEREILIFSLTGLIVSIFPFVPSGNFFNNWLNIILILNLANYIYFREKYLNV